MARTKGGNNNMRTAEEKEKIVKDLLDGKMSWSETWKKYKLSEATLFRWKYAYLEKGIEGLKSNIGKAKGGNKGLGARKPKTREEELELELLKKEIELMRLKKGYQVKGVGAQKEYVTTFDANMK